MRFFIPLTLLPILVACASSGSLSEGRLGSTRDPHEMLSKTRKATFDLLGTPDLNRKEGRTMQWQYRGDLCTLDVFFVAGANRTIKNKDRVQHFELRPSSSDARMNRVSLERCYARLVKERRKNAKSNKKG